MQAEVHPSTLSRAGHPPPGGSPRLPLLAGERNDRRLQPVGRHLRGIRDPVEAILLAS
jgi:hypothetical protein